MVHHERQTASMTVFVVRGGDGAVQRPGNKYYPRTVAQTRSSALDRNRMWSRHLLPSPFGWCGIALLLVPGYASVQNLVTTWDRAARGKGRYPTPKTAEEHLSWRWAGLRGRNYGSPLRLLGRVTAKPRKGES